MSTTTKVRTSPSTNKGLTEADKDRELERLLKENAELSGLAFATGIILTQLLQTITMREMNPQNAATKIISSAEQAIEGFNPEQAEAINAAMKAWALKAVKRYETQLRSVLPV
jgi:hypothetical protein